MADMNWFDRAIGTVAPRAGLRRVLARQSFAALTRGYDGAAKGRRTDGWRAPGTSADAEIAVAGGLLRDRMRDLVRNNPHAAKAVSVLVNNIVGAGIMVDGRLRKGHDAAAGTVDHLSLGTETTGEPCRCGRRDCLAALASDVAVLAKARGAGLAGPYESFESLVGRSRSGDAAATGLLRTRAELAGVAAATLMDLLDPGLLVLGGGLLQTPEHLGALRAAAAGRLTRPSAAERIVPTGLGEGSLVRGSASLVLHAFFTDPVGLLPS